jgi:DUF4097 and DUF4098 domain-containing protein YvlB
MKNIMHEETYKNGEVPRYERPRRRRTGRIIALIIFISLLVVLIAGGLGIGYRLLNPTAIHTTTETRLFHLVAGMQPMLIVSDSNGFVHVRPGAGNIVTVTATKVGDSFGANPGDFNVSYSQSGNTITIQVTNDSIHFFDFSASSQADLDVTVPASSDLQLETGSGEITATGIQGKMTLTSNSGSLQATDVLLTSGSHLRTGSGSMLVRGSTVTSGQYKFQSNSGAIDVTLPRSTSFHAELVSNSGTIMNDFPIAAANQTGAYGRTVSVDVGSSPQATVTIQSDSGSLHLGQI